MSSSQVLLFSDISDLIEFSQDLLIQDRFDQKKCFIVVSEKMKEQLYLEVFRQENQAGFSQMSTLNIWINQQLKYYGGVCDFLLWDKKRLFLCLKVLFFKDPCVKSLFIKEELDHKQEEELLQNLAFEMSAFVDIQKGDIKEPKALLLKDKLRSFFPQYFFLDDALKFLEKSLKGSVFIGFPTISGDYLDLLKDLDVTILSLVPTSSYLGDVLDPKEHLLFLKKLKKQSAVDFYEQKVHPLLGYFSKTYAKFYTDLYRLDISVDVVEKNGFEASDLGILQQSLEEGFLENPLQMNDTVRIESFSHPYSECLAVFEQIKRFKGEIKSDEIAVLSSNPETYEMFLNAIGQSLDEKITFSYPKQNTVLFDFIQWCFLEKQQQNSINFINVCILKMIYLCPDLDKKEKYKRFLTFFQNVQEKGWTQPAFSDGSVLEKLAFTKKVLLKSVLFDLDPFELDYEGQWLLEALNLNDVEELLETIDSMVSLFALIENPQERTLLNNIKHFIALLRLPFFSIIDTTVTLLKLHTYQKEFQAFDLPQEILSSLSLLKDAFCFKKEIPFDAIEIYDLSTSPIKTYKAVFYLGMNVKPSNRPTLLIKDTSASLEKSLYPLWFNAAKFLYSISDLRGYPDLSVNESILWMDQLKSCFKRIEKTTLLTKQASLETPKECLDETFLKELVEQFKKQTGAFCLEIKTVENFLKDEQAFIEQHLLGIKKEEFFLDQNIHLFNLLAWKLQQIKNMNADKVDLSYFESLKRFEEEVLEEGFIRTRFLEEDDTYQNFRSCWDLELGDNIRLQLYGSSNESKEKKILKNKEEILKLLAIMHFSQQNKKVIYMQ